MGQTQTKKKNKERRRPKNDTKEEHFIINGGILQEKQIALSQGRNTGLGQLKLFSNEHIERATNNYAPDLVIGGIQFIVYKGILEDRVVAVKAPRDSQLNPDLVDFFLTEAATGMAMNHDNMVKMYGCCLDTYIPILIYEYMPNGSLFHYLHESSKSIKWSDRLRVATDTGYALSYIHNALSKPVVHRDFQSSNILLDNSFHAKLSNFGYSVSITPGETSQKWPVYGTPGYTDPEYFETREVTEKCDVYSFGVLLLELLTRRQPYMMARCGRSLVDEFISAVENDCMMEMMDIEVLDHARRDEIQVVAELALTCVAEKGADRPTMIDAVSELRLMQDSYNK